ncbi:MAG: hypothetical protein IJV55_02440 [Paludibacteraceae bacterium]|nr:hypothetical protein [Paludibacteraceae bacterium]MBQ9705038.1 hypothetical protein [Paludibacteraceae bacterium]
MISKTAIDIAYAFIHQKLQVYMYSNMNWQRDDIEASIGNYVQQMNRELYQTISEDKPEFLLTHGRFEQDMKQAVEHLEKLMHIPETLQNPLSQHPVF